MSAVLGTTSGELEILWTLWSEYGPATISTVVTAIGSDEFAAPGRTDLPALRRFLPTEHSFLRPVRTEHDVLTKYNPPSLTS